MNLKELVEKILYSGSNWTRKEGEVIFYKDLVTNVSSKKIDFIYHIYGNVEDEKGMTNYNSHVKVDIKKEKLIGCKCTCAEYKESCKYNNIYVCKHIMGVTYKFYDLAQKRIIKKTGIVKNEENLILDKFKDNKNSRILKLDIKLKYINNENTKYYKVEFRVGENNTYLIKSLEEFINARRNNIAVTFNKDFTYKPWNDKFSKKDEEVIDYIKNYVDINKLILESNYKLEDGKTLRILPNALRGFLNKIDEEKVILLNYDYLDYASKVIKNDVPISFSIKGQGEKLILKTKKKFPIPLNGDKDVFLFDRKIYVPSKKQVKFYTPFYNELKKTGQIKLSKSLEILDELIKILRNISDDILLDEEIRGFTKSLIIPQFHFKRIDEKLFCEVRMKYPNEILDILKDNKSRNFLRDINREEKISMELEKLRFIKKSNVFMFIGDDEEIFNLLSCGIHELKRLGNVYLSDAFKDIHLIKSSDINIDITEYEDNFKFKYNLGDIALDELNMAYDAFKNNHRFYKTKNYGFLDFTDCGTRGFLNLLEILNNTDKFNSNELLVDKNKSYYLIEELKKTDISSIRGKETLNEVAKRLYNRETLDFQLPKGLNATLRKYQVVGYNWIKTLNIMGFGGILADEMGLGKTIQTIVFLLSEKDKKSIIITPTSLIYNWQEELNNFAPSLKIGIIHGSKEERCKVLKNTNEYDVLLTTYGTLKNDIEYYENRVFDFCIIDEAQNIKNPSSQNSKMVKDISGKFKLALSGTPIENNLMELWSIFDFIMPGYLFSKEKFKEKFINSGEVDLEELKSLINPFILRRFKCDVISELPDKIEKKYIVEMTAPQKQIYKSYIEEVKNKIALNKEDKITVLSYLTKLRQLCLDPSLIFEEYEGGNGKIKVALNLVNDGIKVGKKMLIFSQFTSVLKNLSKEIDKLNINYLYLDGSTSAKERLKLVNKFNEEEDIKVFLISLKAGGTGLNLTSASLVLHFDPWWNPSIEDQATDRAHRIGQRNVVEVIKLVSKDTIEEKIIVLQEDKKELIKNVMNGDILDGGIINRLTDEEILSLFS